MLTSVGLPTIPANPPATPAHAMVDAVESFEDPDLCCRCRERMLYSPKRAVEYVDWRRMEAERPDQRDRIPMVRQKRLVCQMVEAWEAGRTVTEGELVEG